MSNKFLSFLTGAALLTAAISAQAADNSVATVPDGMISLAIEHGTTNYLSIPLTNTSTYSGTVSTVSANGLTVDDNPAPFTSGLATPDSPYFIKFLTGNEAGRVMLVTSNTDNSLTVDTTDHISGEAVALTATNFNVQSGDAFEIFPGDTVASVFGDNSSDNPLVLTGGTNGVQADGVSLYTATHMASPTYYFNTRLNCWVETGHSANANNTIIYPYSAFTVLRRASHGDTTLTLGGRVTQVAASTKLASRGSVFTSTHYAADVTLSELQFDSNWVKGKNAASSDTISVWDSTKNKFVVFYQLPDSTWRSSTDAKTDQSNYVVAAGVVTTIAKKAAVAGATAFLASSLPYSLE